MKIFNKLESVEEKSDLGEVEVEFIDINATSQILIEEPYSLWTLGAFLVLVFVITYNVIFSLYDSVSIVSSSSQIISTTKNDFFSKTLFFDVYDLSKNCRFVSVNFKPRKFIASSFRGISSISKFGKNRNFLETENISFSYSMNALNYPNLFILDTRKLSHISVALNFFKNNKENEKEKINDNDNENDIMMIDIVATARNKYYTTMNSRILFSYSCYLIIYLCGFVHLNSQKFTFQQKLTVCLLIGCSLNNLSEALNFRIAFLVNSIFQSFFAFFLLYIIYGRNFISFLIPSIFGISLLISEIEAKVKKQISRGILFLILGIESFTFLFAIVIKMSYLMISNFQFKLLYYLFFMIWAIPSFMIMGWLKNDPYVLFTSFFNKFGPSIQTFLSIAFAAMHVSSLSGKILL
ncbi:hypothetical protein TRFO_28835 [Tritrichomonas foetus]|uniref:Uncharacterized protein n=1 Tax=Tritrichomonas foetus TaxID=1144522 RepID=A0A1J4K1T3_9EUKA|nr:hypothetical protein TRFO_28835 [Tritrichomonas foetus]|eukprot:OHT03700.1 hypothetical protein TRFO_28835 [Tritrichomonas foetus]